MAGNSTFRAIRLDKVLNLLLLTTGFVILTGTSPVLAQTITSSDLEDSGFVCPGVPITLTCTTIGSPGITWRSQEYIGDPITLSSLRLNATSTSVNTTVATLTRNENGILESTLRIIPTLNHLTSSVVCVHTDSGNSTSFTINVIDNQTACEPTTTSLPLTSVADQTSTTIGQAPASLANFALIGLIVFLAVAVV